MLTNNAVCNKIFEYRLIKSVPNRAERFRKLFRSTEFGESIIREVQIVTAKVVEHGKAEKIFVFKYKAKSNYRKRQGHRQPFTKVEISKIEA